MSENAASSRRSATRSLVLCALMVFFPILVSTVVGLRHIDSELLEAAAVREGEAFQVHPVISSSGIWPVTAAVISAARRSFSNSTLTRIAFR